MKITCLLAVLLVALAAGQGPAITGFSGGNQYESYYGSATGDVIGWRFTVSEAVSVTDLGVWNADQTGALEIPHQSGLWDDSQALLAEATAGPGGTVVGDWIYAPITPVTLNPGTTYTLGTLYWPSDGDWYISSASSVSTDPIFTWIESTYPASGDLGFVFPANSSTSYGRFGPNLIYTDTALSRSSWGAIKATF